MEESTLRGNFFHQNDVESDLESNRGIFSENPGTIYIGPDRDAPAVLLLTYLLHSAQLFLRS